MLGCTAQHSSPSPLVSEASPRTALVRQSHFTILLSPAQVQPISRVWPCGSGWDSYDGPFPFPSFPEGPGKCLLQLQHHSTYSFFTPSVQLASLAHLPMLALKHSPLKLLLANLFSKWQGPKHTDLFLSYKCNHIASWPTILHSLPIIYTEVP
jgi:hypothetical protein